jgi:hypothetical protein
MNRTTATLIMAGLAVLVMAGSASAQTEMVGLEATFRCPRTTECSPAVDGIQADGTDVDGADFYDYGEVKNCTFNPKTGRRSCSFVGYEGAFINPNGGLQVNLTTEPDSAEDRVLAFNLGSSMGLASTCLLPKYLAASKASLVMNYRNAAGVLVGIEGMTEGDTVDGSRIAGNVNFTPEALTPGGQPTPGLSAGVTNVFLRFGDVSGPTLLMSRGKSEDGTGNTWVVTSTAEVSVECYISKKGRLTIYTLDKRSIPFQLTVTKVAQ